jgi:hypothetical protein
MTHQVAPIYVKLRAKVFAFKDEKAPAGFPQGVIVETGRADGVVTLLALSDGAVGMILSNGRSTLGAGKHVPTARAAAFLGATAKEFASDMPVASDTDLPSEGEVRIYVLIDGGVRAVRGKEADFLENRLPQSPIFLAARNVMATISTSRPA